MTLCGFGPGPEHEPSPRSAIRPGLPTAASHPIDRRSGRSINSAAASRRGNHRLKNAMFLAAFVAIRHDPAAKANYQRKRAEGKKHNAAVTCVARRRCDLIGTMLTRNEPTTPPATRTTGLPLDNKTRTPPAARIRGACPHIIWRSGETEFPTTTPTAAGATKASQTGDLTLGN